MRDRSRATVVALLVLLGFGPVQAAPPAKVEITYEMQRNDSVIADVVARLSHDGRRYQLDETWTGRGLYALRGEARRSSRGRVTPEGLRPDAYSDERGRKSSAVRFDWSGRKITQVDKGASQERAMPSHPVDRLTLVFGFAFAAPGTSLVRLDVVDGRGSSAVAYQNTGRERVVTPAGAFDALHLVKRRDSPQDRGTELWLAERLGLLPVRILVLEKDGTRLDQRATRIESR